MPSPSSSPSSSTSSFCYVDVPPHPPRLPSFVSAFFKRRQPPHVPPAEHPPPPQHDLPETLRGIHIQLPPGHSHSHLTRKQRLAHLQHTIHLAVLDAGMSGSPGNTAHPEKHSDGDAVHPARGRKTADALFSGTYGQLMAALEGAGLSAAPCMGDAISGYTRLGALFVARNGGASGVQLRKITLWA